MVSPDVEEFALRQHERIQELTTLVLNGSETPEKWTTTMLLALAALAVLAVVHWYRPVSDVKTHALAVLVVVGWGHVLLPSPRPGALRGAVVPKLTELMGTSVGLIAAARNASGHYDLRHLVNGGSYSSKSGPVQDDEALFIFSLIRMLRPKVLVEFGVATAYSSRNILKAINPDPEARLFSYDLHRPDDPPSSSQWNFSQGDQRVWSCAWLGGQLVDFVLIDSCHRLKCYTSLWERLQPCLSFDAVVVLHDTGVHSNCPAFLGRYCGQAAGVARCITEMSMQHGKGDYQADCITRYPTVCEPSGCGVVHQVENRVFSNVVTAGGQWQAQHLHSTRVYRHGLTVFTRPWGTLPFRHMQKHDKHYRTA